MTPRYFFVSYAKPLGFASEYVRTANGLHFFHPHNLLEWRNRVGLNSAPLAAFELEPDVAKAVYPGDFAEKAKEPEPTPEPPCCRTCAEPDCEGYQQHACHDKFCWHGR